MARSTPGTGVPPSQLGHRDRAILSDLARVRLLTGRQLERLHFAALATSNARGSARRRSLGRLVSEQWVTTLPRQVGGERAGSAGLVYILDSRAHRERSLWDIQAAPSPIAGRVRRPWAIGWMFVSHSLDVAELYVQLREAERAGELSVLTFDAEPASWFSVNQQTPLKPDAHVVLEIGGWERHWWIEVDRATESLPTLRRKLSRYVETYRTGAIGPEGVLPRVLITAPNVHRADQIGALVQQLLTAEEQAFIAVSHFDDARSVVIGDDPRPPP